MSPATAPGAVPAVDLADLATDDASRRDRAAAALRDGFGSLGLVTVAGHGLASATVERLFDTLVEFVHRDEAAKRAYHRPDLWHQRGWTPANTERARAGHGQPDFKECWFAAPLPLDPDATLAYPELYAPNVGLCPLDAQTVEVGLVLHAVGVALLGAAERALGMDEGALLEVVHGAAHVTRALHYLPLSEDQAAAGVLWGEEHTDFNLLTVLGGSRFLDPSGQPCGRPDDQAGLYLRTRGTPQHPHGTLVRGVAPPGHLVSQVGQQLEILTGGRLQATPHGIRAPRTAGTTRSAVAHFLHAHPFTSLAPRSPFRSRAALQTYAPPRLAGTYALKTLVDIGLAPVTALDALGFRQQDRLDAARAER